MIRVACLGAGYFSQFHIDGWQRIDAVALVGICDLEQAKAAATGLARYDTLTQMLSDAKPDVLDIILPPAGHVSAIRTAIAAGLKTIICQKPFCASPEEAKEMATLAARNNVNLIVHENFRFQPWYRAIKASIDAGDIGDPVQATFRLRPGDGQGPEAYLDRQPYFRDMPRFLIHETGVHWIDTFRFLFGDPTAVYADLRRVNPTIAGEDAGFVIMDHPNGVRAVMDGNRCLDHPATNTRCTMGEGLFEGLDGTLTLFGDGSVHLRKISAINSICIHPPDRSETFGGDCTYHLQAHVIAALTSNFPLENDAASYLNVIYAEEAVYLSSECNKKVTINSVWQQ